MVIKASVRNLRYSAALEREPDGVGKAIRDYVHHFDRALKLYFDYLGNPVAAAKAVEQVMAEYCRSEGVIV